jgi:hypothetical protein
MAIFQLFQTTVQRVISEPLLLLVPDNVKQVNRLHDVKV